MFKLYKFLLPLAGVLLLILFFILNQEFTPSKTSPWHTKVDPVPDVSKELQDELQHLMAKNESDALSVMRSGQLLISIGQDEVVSNVASVRKSIISALFGIAENKNLLKINRTLAELGIDDTVNPLRPEEKRATVEDLLKARSGVFIYSIGESAKMKELRPARGAYRAGEFFYYNNWDFNTLGLIFEQETKMSIGHAFYEWIAKPTGMKNFHPDSVVYQRSEETSIPMYRIYMCTADLVRFGSLYANNGLWGNQQIIPAAWIAKSFTPYSRVTGVEDFTGYGYLWWIKDDVEPKNYWAVGAGGQFILVDKVNQLTICMMNNTGTSPLGVQLYQFGGKKESTYDEVRDVYRMLLRSLR